MSMTQPTLAAAEFKPLLNENTRLIDVRTKAEHRSEHVTGACCLPLDQISAAKVKELVGDNSEPVYLICEHGRRSRIALEKLQAEGLSNIISIDGGTQACIKAGLPIERGSGSVIPLERQTQIGAGTLVLIGAACGFLVHPGWFGLSGFVGAGLVFAGLSGFCGMGQLLALMPWNR